MTFTLYDSAVSRLVPLDPITPGAVKIYSCGLGVYAAPHLGHIRKEIVFDLLRRWLTYEGLEVTLVTNVTDLDDKILRASAAAGVEWFALAYHFETVMHEAMRLFGCLPPTYEPRATGHIPEMVELIQTIMDNGHAYAATDGSGDVYFDVLSWPSYGELTSQRLQDMAPDPDADPRGKRDPRDFALWKGWKPDEPVTASWPTPWGCGRPGWHLECSAMSGKYLGDEFDIHGGGLDLRFPHHENELAQSRAAGRGFARHWMHNAFVTDPGGEKMSKSLGNAMRVDEVVKRYAPRAVRFYLAAPHYRSMVEFSGKAVEEAAASLARVDSFVARAADVVADPAALGAVPEKFAAALDDDLGTPAAVAVLHETVREGNRALDAGDTAGAEAAYGAVRAMLDVFGLRADDPVWSGAGAGDDLTPVVDGLVTALLEQRQSARARKDYAAADAIRAQLAALGLTIEDTPAGPRWSR